MGTERGADRHTPELWVTRLAYTASSRCQVARTVCFRAGPVEAWRDSEEFFNTLAHYWNHAGRCMGKVPAQLLVRFSCADGVPAGRGAVASLGCSCWRKTLALRACRPAPLSCRTRLRSARLRRKSEVFRDAVRQQATAIVAVHNHPSGDPTPSAADVALTVEIVAAGHLLDIELLDHLIIGQGRWLSLKRLGLGFAKA
jgi:hypothetical protein